MNTEAMTQNNSFLIGEIDDALNELSANERDAVVLRYLEDRSHRSVGEALGISEEAARKRCDRATQALRQIFSWRGSGITTSALVVGLSALATRPLPAEVIQRITRSAYQSGGGLPAGAAGFLSFVGGLVLVTVVGGGVHAVAPGLFQKGAMASSIVSHQTSSSRRIETDFIEKEISVKALIAEVKRLYRGPHNAMMKARMAALFEALSASRRQDFIDQAEESLTADERVFAYRPFFTDWVKVDPYTALDTLLAAKMISGSLSKDKGFVIGIFEDWNRSNTEEAEDWLRLHWGNPELVLDGFGVNMQSRMASPFIVGTLEEEGVDAAFAKAGSFGSQDEFPANVRAIMGIPLYPLDLRHAVEIYGKIQSFGDADLRAQLTTEFLQNWKRSSGKHMVDSLVGLKPKDRIPAALFLFGYQAPEETIRRFANGSQRHGYEDAPMEDDERTRFLKGQENTLREYAAEAGIAVAEIDQKIANHYIQQKDERALDLLERLPPGPGTDQVIAEAARAFCENHLRESAKSEVIAFNCALGISDPATRSSVIRGVYRRIHTKDPEMAGEIRDYGDFPEDVASTIRETAERLNR